MKSIVALLFYLSAAFDYRLISNSRIQQIFRYAKKRYRDLQKRYLLFKFMYEQETALTKELTGKIKRFEEENPYRIGDLVFFVNAKQGKLKEAKIERAMVSGIEEESASWLIKPSIAYFDGEKFVADKVIKKIKKVFIRTVSIFDNSATIRKAQNCLLTPNEFELSGSPKLIFKTYEEAEEAIKKFRTEKFKF